MMMILDKKYTHFWLLYKFLLSCNFAHIISLNYNIK